MKPNAALEEFRQVGVNTQMTGASPHRLIAMLFDGLLEKLATARGLMERGEISSRGQVLSKAIAIVDALRASLDQNQGGQLVDNLGSLYDYMELRLLQANSESSTDLIDEVSDLVREIKSGWDAISGETGSGAA